MTVSCCDCSNQSARSLSVGNTALHDCAEAGHLDILKALLEKGANIQMDISHITPLFAAALNAYTNVYSNLKSLFIPLTGIYLYNLFCPKKIKFLAYFAMIFNWKNFSLVRLVRSKRNI